MAFLISVTPLRSHGTRLESLGSPQGGYFVVRRKKASTGLVLISNVGGIDLLGPLYEARVLNASIDGLVLLGYEKDGNAAFVQECDVPPFSVAVGFRVRG